MVRFKRILIAIPSYWTFGQKYKYVHKGRELYDHPIEVPRYQTLTRLLDSIQDMDFGDWEIHVAILIATPHDVKRYEEMVEKLVKKTKVKLTVLFESDIKPIKEKLVDAGYSQVAEKLGLEGYPNVRNVALLLGGMLECDGILFLDDDEEVFDKKLLKKLVKSAEDNDVGISGGVYLNELGVNVSRQGHRWWQVLWNKEKHVKGGLVGKSPDSKEFKLILGGNMLVDKRVFRRVSFDPWITRGEDFDYYINARHMGFKTCINKDAAVLHLPPVDKKLYYSSYWSKLRADMYRFLYTKEKMRVMGMRLDALPPYPRILMTSHPVFRGCFTSIALVLYSLLHLNLQSAKDNLVNLKIVLWDCGKYAKENSSKYFAYQEEWTKMMSALDSKKLDLGRI